MTIDSLSYHGGRGVARYNGAVIFVPRAAPQDRLLIRLVEIKSKFAIGEIEKILVPGPSRRIPPCPVADRCGGCPWQHVSYPEQLEQKENLLKNALRQLTAKTEIEFLPIVGAPQEFRYRNRIQVHAQGDHVGFFEKGSRKIVPVTDCLIAEEDVAGRLGDLSLSGDRQVLQRVEIARRLNGDVVVRQGSRDPEASLFSQVNTQQNLALIEAALTFAKRVEFKKIWDLYCGAGNLTFPLATAFPSSSVIGVELSRPSIREAEELDRHRRMDWRAQDVARFLKEQSTEMRDAKDTLVVLDPPRVGLAKSVVSEIARMQPAGLVYISCNPATFARDAASLMEQSALKLRLVRGVDMFPQTEHVEVVSLFTD